MGASGAGPEPQWVGRDAGRGRGQGGLTALQSLGQANAAPGGRDQSRRGRDDSPRGRGQYKGGAHSGKHSGLHACLFVLRGGEGGASP